jgi:hypothetical protein
VDIFIDTFFEVLKMQFPLISNQIWYLHRSMGFLESPKPGIIANIGVN